MRIKECMRQCNYWVSDECTWVCFPESAFVTISYLWTNILLCKCNMNIQRNTNVFLYICLLVFIYIFWSSQQSLLSCNYCIRISFISQSDLPLCLLDHLMSMAQPIRGNALMFINQYHHHNYYHSTTTPVTPTPEGTTTQLTLYLLELW